jgi:hypothetical protein
VMCGGIVTLAYVKGKACEAGRHPIPLARLPISLFSCMPDPRPSHPRFRADGFYPIRKGRDESEVFADVLLTDEPGWHHAPGREGDGWPENGFRHEDALGMVAQGAMPEIGDDLLGFIEPAVEVLVIFDDAAPFFHAGQGMMVWMWHVPLPKTGES